jgi:hypothetical protein
MIKKTLRLVAVSMLLMNTSCNDSGSSKITDEDIKAFETEVANASKLPKISLDKIEHDFGTITAGDVVSTEFMITNTGESDLIISNASATCGCTVPDYPKQPIAPGDSAPVKVSFDSSGKAGQQTKTVTLITNTETGKELFSIKADVQQKSGQPVK